MPDLTIPESAPSPPADPSPIPVLGPLASLLGSQKFVITLLITIGVLVAVALGRVTWPQAEAVLVYLWPAWLLAHGGQDGLKALGAALAKR